MRRIIGRLLCAVWKLIRDDRTVAEQLKGIAV